MIVTPKQLQEIQDLLQEAKEAREYYRKHGSLRAESFIEGKIIAYNKALNILDGLKVETMKWAR